MTTSRTRRRPALAHGKLVLPVMLVMVLVGVLVVVLQELGRGPDVPAAIES